MNKFIRMTAMLLVLVTVLAFVACTPSDNNSSSSSESTPASSSSESSQTSSSESKAEKVVTYRIKVVDEEGNALPGVVVQLCKDSCRVKVTNEEGWAEFDNDVEDGYHANLTGMDPSVCPVSVPEGKIMDATEYDFASGQTEMTITLKFVDAPAES